MVKASADLEMRHSSARRPLCNVIVHQVQARVLERRAACDAMDNIQEGSFSDPGYAEMPRCKFLFAVTERHKLGSHKEETLGSSSVLRGEPAAPGEPRARDDRA